MRQEIITLKKHFKRANNEEKLQMAELRYIFEAQAQIYTQNRMAQQEKEGDIYLYKLG